MSYQTMNELSGKCQKKLFEVSKNANDEYSKEYPEGRAAYKDGVWDIAFNGFQQSCKQCSGKNKLHDCKLNNGITLRIKQTVKEYGVDPLYQDLSGQVL